MTDEKGEPLGMDMQKVEGDEDALLRRQKAIDYVKNTPCYLVYLKSIPKYLIIALTTLSSFGLFILFSTFFKKTLK